MNTVQVEKKFQITNAEISCFNNYRIQEQILSLIEQFNVVIDMSKILYIDSSGLGMLIKLINRADNYSTNLTFVNFQKSIVDVLFMLDLENLFQVESD